MATIFGPAAWFVLVSLASGPVCGSDADEPRRRALLMELNSARLQAGLAPVRPHPALCAAAQWRASAVAVEGSTAPEIATLDEMRRRLFRRRYVAHNWIESTLIGGWDGAVLEQLATVRPAWCAEAATGDFEHAGIGLARREGRPVYSLLLALPKRTVEWRQAAPLADLEWVRRIELEAVNAVRRGNGRRPLAPDRLLDAAAQKHAEDMLRRAFYSHESLEGATVVQRARAAGYRGWRTISENIAKGPFTPDEVVRRWLDSPGHRRNILRRGVAEMGVGVAFGENANGFEVVWVQVFAGR